MSVSKSGINQSGGRKTLRSTKTNAILNPNHDTVKTNSRLKVFILYCVYFGNKTIKLNVAKYILGKRKNKQIVQSKNQYRIIYGF